MQEFRFAVGKSTNDTVNIDLLHIYSLFQLGDAKERSLGARLAGAAREEAAFAAAASELPSVLDHGDQSQAARQSLACRPRGCV